MAEAQWLAGVAGDGGSIEVERRGGHTRVVFAGDIDLELLDRFPVIIDAVWLAREPVDVDCTEVTFFGAQGVRMLVQLKQAAPDGRLVLATSSSVELVVRASGASDYLRTHAVGGVNDPRR